MLICHGKDETECDRIKLQNSLSSVWDRSIKTS